MTRAIQLTAACAAVLIATAGQTRAGLITAVVATDNSSQPSSVLLATGKFDSVDYFNPNAVALPTLATLLSYDSVLAYTNSQPSNPIGFGNLLADYVDAGGHVVLATYGYSDPWAIAGRITTPGYSPLTNMGVNGNVSGDLVPTVSSDPVFNGVDLGSLSYYHNINFSHPGLDSGANLIATDGAGINMIARNASGNVIGLNLFPRIRSENNDEFFELVANALQPQQIAAAPEPSSLALFGLGSLGMAIGAARRRRRAKQAA